MQRRSRRHRYPKRRLSHTCRMGGGAFRRDKAKVGGLPALTGKRASSPKEKKGKKKETDDSDSSDKTEKGTSSSRVRPFFTKNNSYLPKCMYCTKNNLYL